MMLDQITNRSLLRAVEKRIVARVGAMYGTPFVTDLTEWQFGGERLLCLRAMHHTTDENLQACYNAWASEARRA